MGFGELEAFQNCSRPWLSMSYENGKAWILLTVTIYRLSRRQSCLRKDSETHRQATKGSFQFCSWIIITHLPQEYDGKLNFATDCWTSPNHRAYMAVTVHLEHRGETLCMLLDIVEVAKTHSGFNLAAEFARILEEFKIERKVSDTHNERKPCTHLKTAPQHHLRQCHCKRCDDRWACWVSGGFPWKTKSDTLLRTYIEPDR